MTAEANPSRLPEGVEPYRRTDLFTEATIPAALLHDHSTKAGTWGMIHVVAGHLRYRITDPRREPAEVILSAEGPPGTVEPTILHQVEPLGLVQFYVEFHRAADPTRSHEHKEPAKGADSPRSPGD